MEPISMVLWHLRSLIRRLAPCIPEIDNVNNVVLYEIYHLIQTINDDTSIGHVLLERVHRQNHPMHRHHQ